MSLEQRARDLRHHIELLQIHRIPRNCRIRLQAGLSFFTLFVKRRVSIFQPAARSILDYLRPCLISFAERNRVGMLRATVAAKSFVGQFRYVGSAHYHRHARRPNRIGNAIGLGNHPGHGSNPDQADFLLLNEPYQFLVGHWLGVSVNQQYLVTCWRQRFKQKHPEVRHEVARHAIIRVVQKDFHNAWLGLNKTLAENEEIKDPTLTGNPLPSWTLRTISQERETVHSPSDKGSGQFEVAPASCA